MSNYSHVINLIKYCFIVPACILITGCGYQSEPGIQIGSQEHNLSNGNKLVVERYLDHLKAGNPFLFNFFILKCYKKDSKPIVLLEDRVGRYPLFGGIPKERIQFLENGKGYMFYDTLLVFDQDCNKISQTEYFRLNIPRIYDIQVPDDDGAHVESVKLDVQGKGWIRVIKKSNGKIVIDQTLETNDWGKNWVYPNTNINLADDIKVTTSKEFLSSELEEQFLNSRYKLSANRMVMKLDKGLPLFSKSIDEKQIELLIQNSLNSASLGYEGFEFGSKILFKEQQENYEILFWLPENYGASRNRYQTISRIMVRKDGYALTKLLADSRT